MNEIELWSYDEVANMPDPKWLIKGLVPQGLSVLYAPPSVGKSFLALDWAMHIALGQPWHGHKVVQGAVVYINTEASAGLGKRATTAREALYTFEEEKQLREEDVEPASPPIAFVTASIPFGSKDVDARAVGQAFREYMKKPVVLVVIDTLARNFAGDENEAEAMGAWLNALEALTKAARGEASHVCSILVVHHTGHNQGRERGSSALKAAADLVMSLTEAPEAKLVNPKQGPAHRMLRLSSAAPAGKPPKDGEPWDVALGLVPVQVLEDLEYVGFEYTDEHGELVQEMAPARYGAKMEKFDEEGSPVTTLLVAPGMFPPEEVIGVSPAERTKTMYRLMQLLEKDPGSSKREVLAAMRGAKTRRAAVLEALVRTGQVIAVESKKRGLSDRYYLPGQDRAQNSEHAFSEDLEARLIRRPAGTRRAE